MAIFNQNMFAIPPFKVERTLSWDSNNTVCFTGHRPPKIGGYNPNPTAKFIYDSIHSYIHRNIGTINTYISGLALGVDTLAAQAVLTCKYSDKLPVRLIVAIPFINQPNVWPPVSKAIWKSIKDYSDLIVEVSAPSDPMNNKDASRKLLHRNIWMLTHSGLCYAVWNGDTQGGTYHCLSNARRMGMKEFILGV